MSTRTEGRSAFVLGVLCALQAVAAEGPVAPAHPLDDPAALKAAFAARIARPVNVLAFTFGEHYAEALVQDAAASDEFDVFEAAPGQPMAEGKPKKAGEVDCKKKIPFAQLDLATGAHLLVQTRAIAAANGYTVPENVLLGADIFCNQFGWRALLTSEANSDTMLEISWTPDGASPKARQLKDGDWVKLDMKTLAAGTAKPPAAAPKAEEKVIAGDGRARDFLRGIDADLARIEAQVGAPLGFRHISIDASQLAVDVFRPDNRKKVATWLVDAENGGIRLWREDETMVLDCNKPFATADFPLAQLPALIAGAPALIPPMAQASIKNVAIYRSGFCGKPHVFIQIEDERGYGNVEYDQRGKLVSAEIQ
ncbi:hypothetical protein [Dokdonella sp.]|uniref:hypothetical protein n=1 Tax=Dokdonella sp. TaxID=2291710 RepID=UPI0037837633